MLTGLKFLLCGPGTGLLLLLTPDKVSAQELSIYDVYLSIQIKNGTLIDAFRELEKKTGFVFSYNDARVKENTRTSIHAESESLASILSQLSKNANLKFRRINQNIHVSPRELSESAVEDVPVAPQVIPQDITVTGKVISSDNEEALPGVSVIVKGTMQGTVTDTDGHYSLRVPDQNAVLVFSFVGYVSGEVIVGSKTVIDFSLVPDVAMLDEVVVIGYGEANKSDLTGAVSSLRGKSVQERQTTKAANALQGAIPGLMVTRSDGRPGADPVLRIRGITTMGNSTPYILIDGVPGDLNRINPYDIENVTVLKDGASASIYGSRAASGVILITTKRGKSGKLDLTYSYEHGLLKPTRMPKYMGAVEFMKFINERDWNDRGNTGSEYPTYAKDLIDNYSSLHAEDPEAYPDTDYATFFKEYSGSKRHLLNISAGTSKMSTMLSASYSSNSGFLDMQAYKTLTLRSNNDITFNKVLAAHFDISYQNSREDRENGYGMINLLKRMPNALPFWSDGRAASSISIYAADMARARLGGINKVWNDDIRARLAVDITPLKGLKLTGVVSPYFDFYRRKAHLKQVPLYLKGQTNIAGYANSAASTKVEEDRNHSNSVMGQLFANYSTTFSGDHNFDVMAGYESFYSFNETLSASRDQYELHNYPYLNVGPLTLRDNSGGASESALQSYFGRLMYNFRSKYLLQLNARYDGSSRFHPDYRWGLFPSVSAGWVITKERFMEDIKPLSLLKVRASMGSLGNERSLGSYPYQSTIAFTNVLLYSGQTAVSSQAAYVPRYPIRDISWETTTTWDLGLEAGFFNGHLQLTADYFRKTTRDMLLALEIPRYVGLANPSQNAGEMYTKGWELDLRYSNHIGDLYYMISGNIFDSRSIIGDLKGTEFLGSQVRKEGSEFNEWYGYQTDGLFQTQQEVDNSVTLRANTKPGDIRYKDLSGPEGVPDGIINQYDLTLLGGSLPRYQYGSNINLQYKNFDLSVVLQGIGKQNSYLDMSMVIPDHFGVPDFVYGKTWSHYNDAETNRQAFYPIGGELGRTHNYETSDYWLFNGSYFRLKNVILGYNVSSDIAKKIGMKSLRASVNLTDIFSIDKYPQGYDPEQGTGRGYFMTKSYIFSLSANF